MPVGTVKYVSPGGDYGFISRDDREPKVFVHVKEVHKVGLEDLEKGLRFSFDIAPDEDGRPGAVRLVPLPTASRPASRR